MRASQLFAGAWALIATTGCADRLLTQGLEEPISVQDAQFIEGELPGLPPLTREQVDEGVAPVRPNSLTATAGTTRLRPHLGGVVFSGYVSDDAVALALRIEGQGSGYWVFPAGALDPSVPGSLTWRRNVDFHAIPPGRHRLLVAAIDAEGRSGTQVSSSLCIHSPIYDNGNACDPRRAPPATVISLTWDRPVDLDLVVTTPTGDVIDAKDPASGPFGPPPQQRLDRSAPGAGYLDLDSNRDCVLDGVQRENVIFEAPLPGRYRVYANLYDACGEASARYELTVNTRAPGAEEGTFEVAQSKRLVGNVIDLQANSGDRRGTYITEFVLGE